jgi:hypothetical protein
MQDNKKKTIVVAALGLVIVCLGVFQFVRSTAVPPELAAAAAKREAEKQATVKARVAAKDEGPKNPLFAFNLPARDPFEEGILPTDTTKQQPAQTQAPKVDPRPPVREIGGSQLPVFPGGPGGPLGAGSVGIEPVPEAKFGYRVSGVMLGAKPMAVFTDAQGNQRLLMMGGSLDPDSNVVSIDKDAVTVRFHGKTLRLTVEGNPNAK